MTDRDYGPPTDHPNDPRNDDDDNQDFGLDPLEEAHRAEEEHYGNDPDHR